MSSILITGFPGFLASALLPRIARRRRVQSIVCLIQPQFRPVAEVKIRDDEVLRRKVTLVEGNIVQKHLAETRLKELQSEIEEIFHLAAVYDLSVDERTATEVNVIGTRNVIDFAQLCPALSRVHYFSTCYVSGRYEGEFRETDLVRGQSFNNHYEHSKYQAELEVQAAMRSGMPTTIYRPSIVIGDSRTGATQKYDGPYGFIRWLLQFDKLAPVVTVGNAARHRINLVPRDYVVDAIDHLSGLEDSRGRVYQLCDPSPMTVADILEELGRIMNVRLVKVRMPYKLARMSIERSATMRNLGIVPEALDYFSHPAHYRCEQTIRDLDGSGIECPPLTSYLPAIVDYLRRHPARPGA